MEYRWSVHYHHRNTDVRKNGAGGAEMIPYVILYLISVFIASISQILLKKSAMKQYNYKFGDYLNAYVI